MKLFLDRKWKKDTYTIGVMYINGQRFSETIEDIDRGLNSNMSEAEIKTKKIYGQTAIPTGTYSIRMDIVSPKYSMKPWYVKNCNGGKMPRLEKVPGYEGVLIHPGNTSKDTNGCILVGRNTVKGQVTNSKVSFLELYKKMYSAYRKGEKITLTIK